jgi:spermidine synthase/S-adenosylmethionine/arginine decarboxylase-like enzyme
MSVTWKNTVAALVTLLICSNSLVIVRADASKPKSAAANDAADLTSDHNKEDDEPLPVKLTKWLDSVDGGYFNDKQEVRPVNDGSDGSDLFYGIFAKEFIAKGDLLSEIPWEYIITDIETDTSLSRNDFADAVLKCGTARNLAKEMKQVQTLGKYIKDPNSASKFGPYIQYLLDQSTGIIPSDWSFKGKTMFQDILGGRRQTVPPQYATTWLDEDWLDDCRGDPNDDLGAKAAMIVVSRADDDLLVPVYDMYNHRNGKWYNSHMTVTRGVKYEVIARKDIQAGEQIYNSYNMCENCGGRKDGYGTPELFRDYGFVEDFPQRWHFEDYDFLFDLAELETGEIELRWAEEDKPKDDAEKAETKQTLMKELQRLVKKRNEIWKSQNGKSSIKESEWNSLWNFHQAMVNALSYAFNDLVEDDSELIPVGKDTCTSDGACGFNYFDKLGWQKDTARNNHQTCDNKEIMMFPDYFMLEGLKTHYQQLNFAFSTEDGDICMDLEDTVQICSSYRPHYHEFSSHFAGRFVDDVKNVVFVGGGDSMMLHEVLKYPHLEKVVGLELDQTVVRKSFKYFRTQAHFDNDKVEWWFGDATKSLLLLPEDYWGSFDLVIVDLSETVMALTVTEELDVFDALALLLNPEGVMVKNEHYMETMSKTFDYTLQVYLGNNPKICSQAMIFGSNKADFFHKPVVEHGVETLLLPPVADLEDGFDFFHDFRKNDAMEQGKCNIDTEKKNETTQTKSAGLLHILDAEDVRVTLDDKTVEKIIVAAAKAEGFTKIGPRKDSEFELETKPKSEDQESTVVNVVFEEGYASARIWPAHNYIAVDVGVWGSFQDGDKLRQSIGKNLKAETTSFFRVVVGGMFGSSTWENDKDIIGPKNVQKRNCEESKDAGVELADNNSKKIIIDEVANLFGSQTTVAAVLCGVEGVDKCPSVDVLEQHTMVSKVIPVWTCPELSNSDDEDKSGKFTKMTECEGQVLSTLMNARGLDGEGIALVVLDESARLEMGSILHSILTVQSHKEMLMSANDEYMMSLSKNSESEEWRRNLLERYRRELYHDPAKLVKFDITVGGANMELNVLSNNEMIGFKAYKTFEDKLSKQLAQVDTEASVEVTSLTGGVFNFQDDYNPHEYLHEDYPVEPGNEQWKSQKPLGRKTVVQYDKAKHRKMFDTEGFVNVIDGIVSDRDLYEFEVYTDVGDGVVIVAETEAGSIHALWDGRDHVDLNIFLHDDSEFVVKELLDDFTAESGMNMGLRDDFPRGTGRVMNFKDDLSYGGRDSIREFMPYVELDDDDEDDE